MPSCNQTILIGNVTRGTPGFLDILPPVATMDTWREHPWEQWASRS